VALQKVYTSNLLAYPSHKANKMKRLHESSNDSDMTYSGLLVTGLAKLIPTAPLAIAGGGADSLELQGYQYVPSEGYCH